MRIVMIPCTYTWLNMGDVAMLQAAVKRLRAAWPSARIEIPTKNPEALLAHCPDANPLPHGEWFSDRYLLGGLHRFLPQTTSRQLIGLKQALRRWPALETFAVQLKLKLSRAEQASFQTYRQAIHQADLVVVSGAGGITDVFPGFTRTVLETLAAAQRRGVPTAMFSHGFGQLRSPQLLARAQAVLPRVELIALRESRLGLPLLKRLGVAESRMLVTGDDAVEMAYEARPARPGAGIGVNIRTMQPAEVDDRLIAEIGSVVQEFARALDARLIPLPIARQQAVDAKAIAQALAVGQAPAVGQVLEGDDPSSNEGRQLDTPLKVIEQVGECRLVITGAYHAAVFALAQGIPAVCLAKSQYFVDKFLGLARLFPCGCQVVLLNGRDMQARLRAAIQIAWEAAAQVRPALLENARSQIELSQQAYARLQALMPRRTRRGAACARGAAPLADARSSAASAD